MFMSEIEERLKARAGNLPLKDSYQYNIEKEPEIIVGSIAKYNDII